MEVEEFLKEAAVMKEIKHPNLVQLLGGLSLVSFYAYSFYLKQRALTDMEKNKTHFTGRSSVLVRPDSTVSV